jgi:hypothetical protein
MTLELWNTFATFGTFVVIAATAIAALVQLRHARGSNQIAGLTELQRVFQSPRFVEAAQFVRTGLASKANDPEFRYQLANRDARTTENQKLIARMNSLGVFYENMGLFVKAGLIDRELALSLWSLNGAKDWEYLAPTMAISRRRFGDAFWEDFEYFAVLSQDWLAAHPKGTYPHGVRRIDLRDDYREADRQYAASRVSA